MEQIYEYDGKFQECGVVQREDETAYARLLLLALYKAQREGEEWRR